MKKILVAIIVIFLSSCVIQDREDYYFSKAEECYTNKQYERSIKYIEKAISIDSKNDEYFFALAKIYKEIGKFDHALESINIAIQLNPTRQYFFYKSSYLRIDNNYDDALREIDKAISQNPLDKYLAFRSALYKSLGEYDKAINEYSILYEKRYQFNETDYMYFAEALFEKERYKEVLDILDSALKKDSLNVNYLHKKGLAFFYLEEYRNSIQIFQKTLSIIDGYTNLYSDCQFFIAQSYLMLEHYKASISEFNLLIQQTIENKDLQIKNTSISEYNDGLLGYYLNLIVVLDNIKEFISLRATLKTMISKIEKENIDTIFDYPIAIIYYLVPINDYKLNETDEAISNYRKAVKLDTEYKGDLDKLSGFFFLEDNIDILRKIAKLAEKE